MKIALNQKWRIGGWTQIAQAAIGAGVEAAIKGQKVGTEVNGEGVVENAKPGFTDLLNKNVAGSGITAQDILNANAQGGHRAPMPDAQNGDWLRLLMGGP